MTPPRCDKCGQELLRPGGLAFGPPGDLVLARYAAKFHLCVECWSLFLRWLSRRRKS